MTNEPTIAPPEQARRNIVNQSTISSINVSRFEPEASNMIRIDHFTGSMLLSEFEADRLLCLLDIEVGEGATTAPSEQSEQDLIEVGLVDKLRSEVVAQAMCGIHMSHYDEGGECPGDCIADANDLVDELLRVSNAALAQRDAEIARLRVMNSELRSRMRFVPDPDDYPLSESDLTDEAWNEQIRQLKLDAVCSEIPESVTGEDIRFDIADWLDKRLRPIPEGSAE